ncbi:MAG: bifunctional hydroxymethylpyrimidine kinase/phosphomethylpyrimidine kinase [Clostridiales bacterium]|nr:bifunctional hydroxymethylpyrimidine kinase/phosphomethylpyrimidine kinase [Clostridiales bacterium]MBS5877636.1 bifunctional hydroxymethylpyrimidine kinase/phosphomethylpyrimidine kinase [Clostridiales bacterium]MDU0939477.1 bifunctional hydroxymethylpyrimidine kinase/phosphomethylpyrimidine kinase [Clostridiales bacterium]MDU1042009.1 bifunctional hydroxymethylpyrimidine kinase/phosphomethylpyrimidine kinase [Clostridiales bacterium]MDU3489944.1 bifunctional hydroxymethylpyrimidine kinase/
MKTALTIAGSDPSGGAGIQADLKTFAANGVYGMSVVTALTAQNTLGVHNVSYIDASFVEDQMNSVFEDIFPDAIKIGMAGSPETIKTISEILHYHKAAKIVVDPVIAATSGSTLIEAPSVKALCSYLLPMADVITPNIPEAEILTGSSINTDKDMADAAVILNKAFGCAVLIKGGHGEGNASDDVLVTDNGTPTFFSTDKINNPNTHGTGCTLSSAIAANLAKGSDLDTSIRRAKLYVTGAIASRLDLGRGRGPLNHIYKFFK